MANTLLIGLSRQVALGRELDVVANNIANLNTTGYKSSSVLFEEYVNDKARAGDTKGDDSKVRFVRDRANWIDFSQGPVEKTNNPLDVAIDGPGFLTVQTARGERYTRNGALQINSRGELVTSDGSQVSGESGTITFQPTDRDIKISKDGTISVREGNEARTESQRGKLKIVSFANPEQLQKDGNGTFSAPDGVTPEANKLSGVAQGAIEKSNVRGVIEMTRMIEVTRTYTQVAAFLQQQHDLQRSSIDKLAEVPA